MIPFGISWIIVTIVAWNDSARLEIVSGGLSTTTTTTTIDTAFTTDITTPNDEGGRDSSSSSVAHFGGFTAALVAILIANIY